MAGGFAIDGNTASRAHPLDADMDIDGPMGTTRLRLRKPEIAAVEGLAVAGGCKLGVHRPPWPVRQ